jgi:molecular chaperone GrpE
MTPAEQRSDENSSAAPAEIERLKQELSRAHDMRLRALADFDNYRKRVQREQDSAAQAGKRQLVLALLDVMDDFERALAYANTAPESILTGAFDVTLHDAVDAIKTDRAPSGVVLDELRHGYRWGDEVLRPARVRVAQ